jgi:glycosyltransferase involved in cell wall biosynthesis
MLRQDHTNLEGRTDFDVRWHDPDLSLGIITAVLRVRNEARSLPWVLPGLFRVVDAVVLADNGSDDGTPRLAEDLAREHGATDRLTVIEYPFAVSRCGPEHLATPPDSVHSLTYFYNWAFSHVRTPYCLKWDGDMVITVDGERSFRDLQWQLEGVDAIINIPRHPVYVESADVAYVDVHLTNREPWGWPNKPAYHHGKGFEWEIPLWPREQANVVLPEWTCFELKWLDSDEFEHWSDTDFSGNRRTQRKAREWDVFHAVQRGKLAFGVHRVESPGSTHVIDRLRQPDLARLVAEH